MGKYEATVSFAGEVAMHKGEMRELAGSLAAPLVKCGYLKAVIESESERDNPGSDIQPHPGGGGKSGARRRRTNKGDAGGSS